MRSIPHLRIVSTHPIAVDMILRVLTPTVSSPSSFCGRSIDFLAPCNHGREPHLFILDACSLHDQLSHVCHVLRVRHPGSSLLALVPCTKASDEETLRLMYAGMNGVVPIVGAWQEKLVGGVRSVLEGELWFSPRILAAYVRQTNLLLNQQARSDLPLTARELQVFQLLVRRLSNKEIAEILRVSGRTIKFHVSNVFRKLDVIDRPGLFEALEVVSLPKP